MASEDTTHADLASALRGLFEVDGVPGLGAAVALWPAEPYVRTEIKPSRLPVLDHLDVALDNVPSALGHVARAVVAGRDRLSWGQTYTEADLGRSFIQRYGWTLIVGTEGPIISRDIISGFLLLGPGTEYPPHKHSIEEYYRIVSGRALWKIGDAEWVERMPGEIVHNPPWQVHGMRTRTDEPLLLAYLWRSAAIEKSIFPAA